MMDKSWKVSRRAVLRGLGAAIALPFLDVMGPLAIPAVSARAAATSRRNTRVAYLYFPNGIPRGIWYPSKMSPRGRLERLNEWMSPLEPFKEDLVIPSNIWTPLGNGHSTGTATWLTGANYSRRRVEEAKVSVDQLSAKHVGQDTLLPSLELQTKGEGYFSNSLPRNTISWSAAGVPVVREIEPRAVFDRMFRPPSGGASNRSVMDLVLEDARSLRKSVSQVDQRRLDEYFESIRALEKRIEFAEKQTEARRGDRALTDTLVAPTPGIPSDHGEYMRLMMDMIVLAFQSGATRVCTFMLDHGQSNRYFNFIPEVKGTWHALSHYKDASGETEDDDGITSWGSVEAKRAMFAEVIRWNHRQVAYLLGRMKEINEPDGGTLLDNSMIVLGSSLGDGNEHDENHLPTLIAGRGGGAINTGRYIEFEKPTDLAKIHVSGLRTLGIDIDRFGTGDGPLEELGARWF